MNRALGVAFIVAAAVVVLQGTGHDPQVSWPADVGTGAISGTVVDASDGTPLPGAVVYLGVRSIGPVSETPRLVTDSKGRFVFRNLAASDSYGVRAGRVGYFEGAFGSEVVDDLGKLIVLREGQWFSDAVIRLWKPAAISGRVFDEFGEPVVGAFVQAVPQVMVAGKLQLALGSLARTDDRGRYRLRGLMRGGHLIFLPSPQNSVVGSASQNELALDVDSAARLVVSAFRLPPSEPSGRRQTYAATFFPGVTSASLASPIQLNFGEERQGVDFTWSPIPAVTVSGQLQGPDEALAGVAVKLVAIGNENLGTGTETATARPDTSGRFTLLNVPAGQYRLQVNQSSMAYSLNPAVYERANEVLPDISGNPPSGASGAVWSGPVGMTFVVRGRRGGDAYWADTPLSVGESDISGLSVPLRPALTISGRVVFESKSGKAPLGPGVRVALEPADGSTYLGMPIGQLNPQTHEFTVDGLRSGKYVVRLSLPNGWTVKSTKCALRDCPDGQIDTAGGLDAGTMVITVTDEISEVRGRVLDSQGKVVDDCVVWAFPVQPTQWTGYGVTPRRIKQTRVGAPTGYVIRGLPAGDYFLVALPSSNLQAWTNPAALEAAARLSATIRLGWGETQTRELTLREIK